MKWLFSPGVAYCERNEFEPNSDHYNYYRELYSGDYSHCGFVFLQGEEGTIFWSCHDVHHVDCSLSDTNEKKSKLRLYLPNGPRIGRSEG
jgi:hypothetical protein